MIKTREKNIKVGTIFGQRTTLGSEFKIKKTWHVVCECKCGKIDVLKSSKLLDGKQKSCINCFNLSKIKQPAMCKGEQVTKLLKALSDPFLKSNSIGMLKWYITVQCTCGKVKDVLCISIKSKFTIGCGKCKNFGEENKTFRGYKEIYGQQWCSIKIRALNNKIDFNIDIKYAWELFLNQNKKCALSGIDLIMGETASLDRIDSTKGYELDNVQWTHKDINVSKWDMQEGWYKKLCWLIVNYNKLDVTPIEIIEWRRPSHYKGCGNLSLYYWNEVKRSSTRRARALTFNLNIEDTWNLYLKQGGRCALSGIPIYFTIKSLVKLSDRQDGEGTASLDRIDSTKGYELDNVQWVHCDINRMKLDFEQNYFKWLCDKVSSNMNIPNLDCLLSKTLIQYKPKSIKTNTKQPHVNKSSSKYKGVFLIKSTNKWRSRIVINKQVFNLGHFNEEIDAALAYDKKAKELYGKYCYLNFSVKFS